MTEKGRDKIITVLVNQGLVFVTMFLFYYFSSIRTDKQDVQNKLNTKVDKEVYATDWKNHEKRHEIEIEAIKEDVSETKKMVDFLYQNEINKNK